MSLFFNPLPENSRKRGWFCLRLVLGGLSFCWFTMIGCTGEVSVGVPGCEDCPDRCIKDAEASRGRCVPCLKDSHCQSPSSPTKKCDTAQYRCICGTDKDCPTGLFCKGQEGCVECTSDSQCPSESPACVGNKCQQCRNGDVRGCAPTGTRFCAKGTQKCQGGLWTACEGWNTCKDHEKCDNEKCIPDCPEPATCQIGDKKCTTTVEVLPGKFQACERNNVSCPAWVTTEQTCDKDEYCYQGKCIKATCPKGLTDCNGKCVFTENDREHCGACNQACKPGEICTNGTCALNCPTGQNKCGEKCYDLQENTNHCGACNFACASGESCLKGKCQVSCPASQTACGTVCTNTQTDRNHCGACNKTCNSGEACESGQCKVSCPPGQTTCGKICVDLQAERNHCGACNQACQSGEVCSSGQCATSCPRGTPIVCAGGCVDTQTNSSHCGTCNATCSGGKICQTGQCSCAKDRLDCNGLCVDPKTDRNHCGACNTACPAGQLCSSGSCQTSCPQATPTSCNGGCINPQTDRNHCGSCGNSCSDLKLCVQGQCQCPNGTTECNGICVNTKSDRLHCGNCGASCPAGQLCASGTCQSNCPTQTPTLCGGACVQTNTDSQHCGKCNARCSNNQICNNGTCDCPAGFKNCNGTCVETQTSRTHCGACNNACSSGELCVNGICTVSCPTQTPTNCGGACIDTQTNPFHCGSCNKACNAGEVCSNGKCALSCQSGYTDCSGQCVNVLSDNANCGTCGKSCSSGELCSRGQCQTSCPVGQTVCSGRCTDTQQDASNCGRCAAQCSSGESCVSGICKVVCPTGFQVCTGRCTDVLTNRSHCGQCNNSCQAGHICQSGQCVLSCPTGLSVCNNTCVNLANDVANCGSCGKVCPVGQYCANSQCAVTCPTGLTSCSGSCVNLKTDTNHCGSCGKVCQNNQICQNGSCINNLFVGGNLLNETQMIQINSWTGTPNQKWNLCYKMTTHGTSTSTFHTNCDNKGPTITVALLNQSQSHERLIGGYASTSWTSVSSGYFGTASSFLFSLTHNYKHDWYQNSNYLYRNGTSYGPTFGGGHDLLLGSGGVMNTTNGSYCNIGHTYRCRTGSYGSATCRDDFCGTYNPVVSDVEVYVQDLTGSPLFDNSVLLNTTDQQQINAWYGDPNQRWTLCYRLSTHGSSTSTFHNQCGNLGPTMTVMSLTTNRLIGGYAATSWTNSGSGYFGTIDSFLFSLTNRFKHSANTGTSNYLYRNGSSYGPTFGYGHDMRIGSSNSMTTGCYCYPGYSYICRTGTQGSDVCRNDFCGSTSFTLGVSEIEVFLQR